MLFVFGERGARIQPTTTISEAFGKYVLRNLDGSWIIEASTISFLSNAPIKVNASLGYSYGS